MRTSQTTAVVLSSVLFLARPVAAPLAAPAGAQERPQFRTGTQGVSVSVTVTDKKGRAVVDLTAADFVVSDDRVPRTIVNFKGLKEARSSGIGLGLVLDFSLSMTRERIDSMRTAVQVLFKRLTAGDEIYFVDFSSVSHLSVPWTSNQNTVLDAIRRTRTREGTAIYDAIRDALPISSAGKLKKQVMLVITDGADYNSTVNRTQLAQAAAASDVVIYALVINDEERVNRGPAPVRNAADLRQSAAELSQITDVTGGSTKYVEGFGELEAAITRLGQDFTQQYFVEYARGGAADGKYHEIAVTVRNRPDVTVRHRHGYVAN